MAADNITFREIYSIAQDFGCRTLLEPPNRAMMTQAIGGSLDSFLLLLPERGTTSMLISSTT